MSDRQARIRELAAQQARIRELAAQGMSRHAIASAMGLRYGYVCEVIRLHGIACRASPAAQQPHPPETIERLRQMAARGLSARQIGLNLHMSRNSVLGLGFRHGIKIGSTTVTGYVKPWRRGAQPPGIAQPGRDIAAERWPGPRDCRWIEGEARPRPRWCLRHTTAPGEPYCAAHRARAWRVE